MIESLFQPHVTSAIKAILLSLSNQVETVFWPWNHDGIYTVKSRYCLLLEEEYGYHSLFKQYHDKGSLESSVEA